MKKMMVLIALVALAGCKPGADKAIDLVKKEVAADTRDPDSSKFRYVRFIQSSEAQEEEVKGLVCGQVNAKNGFGAYAGFSSFLVEISMKPKGMFSSGVTYTISKKEIYTDLGLSKPLDYEKQCGPDE
ncbi:hypothetical protein [Klebsiella oxytoca]|uniref:hypothetical protein n=1 Tax=Klebsiella oxytoca TaxID=571 RepID=UPI003AAFB901